MGELYKNKPENGLEIKNRLGLISSEMEMMSEDKSEFLDKKDSLGRKSELKNTIDKRKTQYHLNEKETEFDHSYGVELKPLKKFDEKASQELPATSLGISDTAKLKYVEGRDQNTDEYLDETLMKIESMKLKPTKLDEYLKIKPYLDKMNAEKS